jgi:nitronate monooxygenase
MHAALCDECGVQDDLKPDEVLDAGRAVRARTQRPFGINLFAPVPVPRTLDNVSAAIDRLAPFFAALGLPRPEPPSAPAYSFDDQFAAVLESGASVFSVTFGTLPREIIAAARDRRVFVAGTATTVEEAVALEVPHAADAVSIPVIASGGIMDGRGIAAALVLGAGAVQMGSAFLTCEESGVSDVYRQAILDAHEDHTRVTRAFSGRPARGIANAFMDAVDASPEAILPFPFQNVLTRALRKAGAERGRADVLSLWAGQAARLARRDRAADLVARLAAETDAALERLA